MCAEALGIPHHILSEVHAILAVSLACLFDDTCINFVQMLISLNQGHMKARIVASCGGQVRELVISSLELTLCAKQFSCKIVIPTLVQIEEL